MSRTPYKRRQGDFELRVLRDGRLVMIAPDESLLDLARGLEGSTDREQQHMENRDAEAPEPGSQQTGGR
jgi:hypothetical protein